MSIDEARPSHFRSTPPSGGTFGGGATVGHFFVEFRMPMRELRADGALLVALPPEHNVGLLIERDQSLLCVDTDRVVDDLGIGPPPVAENGKRAGEWGALLCERLREVLHQSERVRAFLSASH
jgi:hypothetical protein